MMSKKDAKAIVDEYRRNHPGISIAAAAEACGVSTSHYYRESKEKSRLKANYSKVEAAPKAKAPEAPADHAGKLFMIIGTPEQLRSMLK